MNDNDKNIEQKQEKLSFYMDIFKYKSSLPGIGILISYGYAIYKHGIPRENILDSLLNPANPIVITASLTFAMCVVFYMAFLKLAIINLGDERSGK